MHQSARNAASCSILGLQAHALCTNLLGMPPVAQYLYFRHTRYAPICEECRQLLNTCTSGTRAMHQSAYGMENPLNTIWSLNV
ncbi:hypothetical protein DPMN_108073 [Dreissena polymorpha]|uniref:Uncharacterized protein n=1 Tax=Dreissena polymorpha TaxID=45954 RepID=A0A9D4K833_DREPO|nr:hypothetical protein DPMN_108073 [Dreissena polymorpha]